MKEFIVECYKCKNKYNLSIRKNISNVSKDKKNQLSSSENFSQ